MKDKSLQLKAKIALFVATIIWGSSFVVLKNTIDNLPIYFVLAIRFFIGFAVLSLVFFKSYKKISMDCVLKGLIAGVVLAFAYIVQTTGLARTTPGKNAFITASYCVIVPFMFWIANRTRPDKYNILSAIICFLGIGLVSLESNFSVNSGDLITLASGGLFALHIVIVAMFGKNSDPVMFTISQFLGAGILCAIGFGIFEQLPKEIPTSSIMGIVYMGIFATAGALFLQNYGQKYTNPSSASIILSFEAVFGVIFSLIFYKERLSIQTVIGFVIIFLAVIVSETKLNFLVRKHKIVKNPSKNISWLLEKPIIHRGDFSENAPENSLKAFEIAVSKGYSIELDIMLSADEEIVVFHDASLKRMCGKRKKVSKCTLAELKQERLLGTEETIPTLKEVLQLVKGQVGIIIELKTIFKHRRLCEQLAKELEGYEGKFSVHSFSPFAMRYLGRHCPHWVLGIVSLNYQRFMLWGLLGLWLNNFPFYKEINPDYIFYHCGHLDSKYIKQMRDNGVKVLCWTIKEEKQLTRARESADNYLCEGEIIEKAKTTR